MTYSYQLKLCAHVSLIEDGDDLLLACKDGRVLRSRKAGSGIRLLLDKLIQGGFSEEQLIAQALAAESGIDLALLYFLIGNIKSKGFLDYTLVHDNEVLITLEMVSASFRFNDSIHDGSWRLSRFALLRRDGDTMIVESPCGHARVVLDDPCLSVLPALLVTAHSMDELVKLLPDLEPPLLEAIVSLFINAGLVDLCDENGLITEDTNTALRHWEFHDLLFHSRSRSGRHAYPLGATYRFKDKLAHAPALKSSMSDERITLNRPESDSIRSDFFDVLEARRSQREQGDHPLTLSELGEFLWYSARVKQHHPADPNRSGSYEMTLRPCPSGGAMHELDVYLTVSRCSGVNPGFYHYDPMAHELEYLADLGKPQQAMLQDAMLSSGLKQVPDVLISLAARFGRVAWKYEGVAYALALKNVGCLYQQMYLVATALKLSPCALGAGNSITFAQATGLDYFTETSVGDFMLSSAPG